MVKKIIFSLAIALHVAQTFSLDFSNINLEAEIAKLQEENEKKERALMIETILRAVEVDRTLFCSIGKSPTEQAVYKSIKLNGFISAALNPKIEKPYQNGAEHHEWKFKHLGLACAKLWNEGLAKSNQIAYKLSASDKFPGNDYVDIRIMVKGAAETIPYKEHPAFHEFIRHVRTMPEEIDIKTQSMPCTIMGTMSTRCRSYGCWQDGTITIHGAALATLITTYRQYLYEGLTEDQAITKTLQEYEVHHPIIVSPDFIKLYNKNIKLGLDRKDAAVFAFQALFEKSRKEFDKEKKPPLPKLNPDEKIEEEAV